MPEEERDHDARDPHEDEVRLAEVAADESRGPLYLADHKRSDDSEQHEKREDIDEERVPALLAQPRQRRVLVDDADHRGKDGRQQDHEAPEDRCVHEAG